MPVQKIPGIIKKVINFTGGVDESSQVTELGDNCLEMENWRLSKDGKRVKKKLGSADQGLTEGEDLYGYTTYYDSSDNFCKLLITESAIKRKVGSAAWSSIHSFSSSIAHPVRPLEIQGKQFVINEVDSRFIHTDGSDYQIGIDAPTTLPAGYLNYNVSVFSDDCSDISGWTEAEGGDGDVQETTSEPGTTATTFRFETTDTVGNAADYASITQDVGSFGNRFKVSFKVYFDTFDGTTDTDNFKFSAWNGSFRLAMYLDLSKSDFYIWTSSSNSTYVGATIAVDTWYTIDLYVDGTTASSANVDVFINDTYYGNYDCSDTDNPGTNGELYFYQAMHDTSVKARTYIDTISVDNTAYSTDSASIYRYAIVYARSGNFGNKSNPIKSVVGSDIFSGSGLDDLTSSGTYTGSTPITIKVDIDGTTPDTIEISYDNGATENVCYMPVATKMMLNYGVTINFAAITGHTSGDIWRIPCYPCATNKAAGEQIKLDPLPTSSDAQVNQRKIYRTVAGGARFYWLANINDNTTTIFYDNIPDSALGTELEEDHDVMPNGKFSVWWDNKLWVSGKMLDDDGVAMDTKENVVYHSRTDEPESFDTDNRYVIMRKGEQADEITQMVDYKDAIYVFKRNAIFIIIARPDGNYGRYLLTEDIGCIASWSMVKVCNLLMFLSHKGWEIYNGTDVHSLRFSVPLKRTLDSIDTSENDFISSCHNRAFSEVLLSLPDRTGGASACTPVYNYASNKFYIFSYHKTPSFFAEARDSSDKIQTYYGTRDGYLLLHDSGYQDGGNNITATMRKGWYDSKQYADIRRIDLEYECPTDMKIVCNLYVNMDKDVARTKDMTGKSPSATDIELRRPIYDFAELGLRAKWVSIEFTNNQNVGGDLKLNECALYYKPRAIKGRIVSD